MFDVPKQIKRITKLKAEVDERIKKILLENKRKEMQEELERHKNKVKELQAQLSCMDGEEVGPSPDQDDSEQLLWPAAKRVRMDV